jgi:hypothetical protein
MTITRLDLSRERKRDLEKRKGIKHTKCLEYKAKRVWNEELPVKT